MFHKHNKLSFNKNKSKTNCSIFILFFIIILFFINIFELYVYNNFFNNFIYNFENNNFSKANILLMNNQKFNPYKFLFLNKDLSKYLNKKLEVLSCESDIESLKQPENPIDIINEIKRYNTFATLDNSLLDNFNDSYENGVNLFNLGNYIQAYRVFTNLDFNNDNYGSSIEYIRKCKENIIFEVISEVTNLCSQNNYDVALNILNNVNPIVGDDSNIVSKIEEIKIYEDDYSYNDTDNNNLSTSASTNITTITLSNINELSLESTTPYLVQVDLAKQRTNIFKGHKKNWNLIKTFSCSSGIEGEQTPTGIYTIQNRGTWFFSTKYNEGAKYWVQFYGNYLFHSMPYTEDKSQIIDFTLGKPASHGCIRLRELDSKWIYDNIPKGSKVIIQ